MFLLSLVLSLTLKMWLRRCDDHDDEGANVDKFNKGSGGDLQFDQDLKIEAHFCSFKKLEFVCVVVTVVVVVVVADVVVGCEERQIDKSS